MNAGRLFVKVIFILVALVLMIGQAQAQTQCPPDMVCITREAAQAALEAGDKAKALEVQLKAEQDAKELIRKALEDMRIEFARTSGENTILKQQQVADRALMTVLIQNTKKKRFGLINIF